VLVYDVLVDMIHKFRIKLIIACLLGVTMLIGLRDRPLGLDLMGEWIMLGVVFLPIAVFVKMFYYLGLYGSLFQQPGLELVASDCPKTST
jgi:hypothetical protein